MKRVAELVVCAVAFAVVLAVVAVARVAQGGKHSVTPINPAVTFAKNCATCHGKDGRSDTFKSRHHVHARNLTDAQWQASVTDEQILNSISNGKGKMPSFKKKLTTEQIESLVAYVRGLKK